VQFIDDPLFQGQTAPRFILPDEVGISNLGGAMNASGLGAGSRIWSLFVAVEAVEIETVGLHPFDDGLVIAPLLSFQWYNPLFRRDHLYFHIVRKRRPHSKAASPFTQVVST
jgi:hypothetical protein